MTIAPLGRESRRGVIAMHTDVTARVTVEQKLRANEARLRIFLDHSTDALMLHDDHARVIDVNRQACERLGYTKEELIGMRPVDFDADASETRTAWVLQRLNAGETITFDSRHRRKDGSVFPVEVRIRPFWVDGRRYALSLARDTTQRMKSEEALHSAQLRMAKILKHANVGLWDWDLTTDTVEYSGEWKSQLGYEDEEIGNSFEEWESRVHPDDLGPTLAKVEASQQRGAGEYEAEFRMRHRDGSWQWILAHGALIPNSGAAPPRMAGIHLDITERKQAETALRHQVLVLKQIAAGNALPNVLEEIVALVEEQVTGFLCAIMLLDEEGVKLRFGAGKSLPPACRDALGRVAIGPTGHSSGMAAYLKKPVIVSDISVDPLWADCRDFGPRFGWKSCWSAPILAGRKASEADCAATCWGRLCCLAEKRRRPTHKIYNSYQRRRIWRGSRSNGTG